MSFFPAIWANYQSYVGVFGVIGVAPLVVAALGFVSFGAPATLANDRPAAGAISAGDDRRNIAIVALCIVAVAAMYVYVMAVGDDLVGIDYATLTAHRFVDIPIVPESGRFFPLALQEYNLINLIGRTATVYYAFAGLELTLLLVLTYRLLDGVRAPIRAVGIAWLLSLPGFELCFQGHMYPERDVMLCLVAWLVCHRLAERLESPWPALGALVAAQYALYLKETTFLLIGGFAAARLLISWRREMFGRGRGGRRLGEFVAAHWLDIGLLALCCTYLVLYAVVILPHVAEAYGSRNGILATATAYAFPDPLVVLFGLAVVVRVAKALAGAMSLDLFWDAAAIGALIFLAGYVKLGMYRDYYAAPADLVAVMYLARLVPTSFRLRRAVVATACLAEIAAIAINVGAVAQRLLDRKVFVAETRALVAELSSRVSSDRLTTLFFPQPGTFQIMELGAYLQYRGIPVKGAAERAEVVFKTPHRFRDDRCLPPQAIRCEFAAEAEAGDLVVLLPGREPPPQLVAAAMAALRASESTPRPFIYRLLARIAAHGDEPSPLAAGAVLAAGAANAP